MADKMTITAMEALKAAADHLGTFYYLYNQIEEEKKGNKSDHKDHIIEAMAGTVASHLEHQVQEIGFAGSKEDWSFVSKQMDAFMKLKKLADDGCLQYSEHKDGYGLPIFEVSASNVRQLKELEQATERCRNAKLSEALEAKVHEVMEQVFFGNGGEV